MSEPIDPAELRARMIRLAAARLRMQADMLELMAKVEDLSANMKAFVDAYRESEAREFAEHPDVAETLAQLEGFYGPE